MLFVHRNRFSKMREFKLINRPFEFYGAGRYLSGKILNKYKNTIYRQDTEETCLVRQVINRVIKANNFEGFLPFFEVTVVHNDTAIMFMNLD